MIKISKNGNEFEYKSLNHACQENGSTSGMNRNACLKYLAKAGFDIATLVEEEKTERVQTTLIERLIKETATVDKEAIKELEKLRQEKVVNMKSANEYQAIMELNEKIEALKNPVVTLEAIHNKVTELWDAYQKAQTDSDSN